MRREVVDVLRKAGATAILVTHDQDEALSIADRVAVLQRGTIVQCDEPAVLYTRPVNGEVARFVGHGNLMLGRLEHGVVQSVLGEIAVELDAPAAEPCAVGVLVRPEQIDVGRPTPPRGDERRAGSSSAASSTATTCSSRSGSTSRRGGRPDRSRPGVGDPRAAARRRGAGRSASA